MRVWTDGAYSSRSGCGGWAWATSLAEYRSGATQPTTNNRMEQMAVLDALLFFYQFPEPIEIISDSLYVVNSMNKGWCATWEKNSWTKKQSGRTVVVPNNDLWSRILKGVRLHEAGVTFEWVRGHSGDRMNSFVDQLAVEQRLGLENELNARMP